MVSPRFRSGCRQYKPVGPTARRTPRGPRRTGRRTRRGGPLEWPARSSHAHDRRAPPPIARRRRDRLQAHPRPRLPGPARHRARGQRAGRLRRHRRAVRPPPRVRHLPPARAARGPPPRRRAGGRRARRWSTPLSSARGGECPRGGRGRPRRRAGRAPRAHRRRRGNLAAHLEHLLRVRARESCRSAGAPPLRRPRRLRDVAAARAPARRPWGPGAHSP